MENNMKQFNLEEYLKNPDREVVTRDGHKVRIICTDRKNHDSHPIIALVESDEDDEKARSFMIDDKWSVGGLEETFFDLFFAPTKHEGWINLPALTPEEQGDFPHPFKIPVFETEAKARMARENVERFRIKIEDNAHYYSVKIEWED